jgi:hypothetical protein
MTMMVTRRSRSSVALATDHWLDGQGSIPIIGQDFSTPHRQDLLSGPQSLLSSEHGGALCPGLKRSGREAEPVTSVYCQGQELWSHIPIPPYIFMLWS